ncbi:hypothetical protein HYH03_009802 [Edaphochlamys debaryana]|uniref:Uncharacterized protein n=1 Tax=Edaphochlamys debaryana TaxID=47281 RepID=A0A836BWM0_9CHLO|nr:hypothetical protein HYH03_009802 [Edaphochlamys debaryana]|eukprot:KAG2491846.1 hypothetical protein HYH03_009802 [Edaphochlamys debaryana]
MHLRLTLLIALLLLSGASSSPHHMFPLRLIKERARSSNNTAKCFQLLGASQSGLGSMLNNWFMRIGLLRLEAPDAEIYLDWSHTHYTCQEEDDLSRDPIQDFFQPTLFPPWLKSAAGAGDLAAKGCIGIDHHDAAHTNRAYNKPLCKYAANATSTERGPRWLAVKRALLQAVCPAVVGLWRSLHPSLQAEADAVIESLPEEPFVALHVRGGDKIKEYDGRGQRLETDHSLLGGMVALATRHPSARGRTCVVMGDDPVLAELVIAHASKILRCKSFHLRLPPRKKKTAEPVGHVQADFNAAPVEQRCNATRSFITDLNIMAAAPYFVGNTVSNVVSMAFWLRGCVHHHDLDTLFDGDGYTDWWLWL